MAKRVKKEKKKKDKPKYNENFVCCPAGDKYHKVYCPKIFTLNIDFFSVPEIEAGFMTRWQVYDSEGLFGAGETIYDFINLLEYLKSTYDLKSYNTLVKDTILFYIDDVKKIYGFFHDYITQSFLPYSCEVNRFFEFRSYKIWQKDILSKEEEKQEAAEKARKEAEKAAKVMQNLTDNIFILEKNFYITPNKRTRVLLKKDCIKEKSTIAREIFPEDQRKYKRLLEALFGGICFCPIPNVEKKERILGLDITSAYIYSLLSQKFPMSKARIINPKDWKKYLNNKNVGSLGVYTIVYTTGSNLVQCYKDYKGRNLISGENVKVSITLNNIDLKIILNLPGVKIIEIKCTYLEIYDLDYLPNYVIKRLVEEYLKKSYIDKKKNPSLYKFQKVVLNGIYGNCIKKITLKFYEKKREKAYLAPQWGVWTTSYTKKHLLGLALSLPFNEWYYSDTDSIYCKDTVKNRKLVEDYNNATRKIMTSFCERTGYVHIELLELGKFEVEHEIVRFKALKQKEYLYTYIVKNDDKVEYKLEVKAAGCNKREMPICNALYKLDVLPVGTKIRKTPQNKPKKYEKDDKIYENNCSYYEETLTGEKARKFLEILARMQEGEDIDAGF